jgi:hypothetical protein
VLYHVDDVAGSALGRAPESGALLGHGARAAAEEGGVILLRGPSTFADDSWGIVGKSVTGGLGAATGLRISTGEYFAGWAPE